MTMTQLRDNLKAWWPMYGVAATLCSVIVLWGGLPGRVARAEEQIDDLKGWAKELQGYTRAMQQQQAPVISIWESQDEAGTWWRCEAPTEQACWDQQLWEKE